MRTLEQLSPDENSDEETSLPVGNATLPSLWAETSGPPAQRLYAEAHVQSDMQGWCETAFAVLRQLGLILVPDTV